VSQERTEAVLLRGVAFSETSRIVTLLTPERGKVACMAKGAYRSRSPLSAALDTFNHLEVVYYWKDGRGVQPLGEATLLNGFRGIKHDLEKCTLAAFPLEMVSKIAHENEPSGPLFDALLLGLRQLDAWTGDPFSHVSWQVLQLLIAAGFSPELGVCVRCGGALAEVAGFDFAGGATCGNCGGDRRLDAASFGALRAMAEGSAACPEVSAPREVFHLLRHYAARQLETDFRSVRVIDAMFNLA
jgi:DNA repair protein RecO (recombination protein O)